MFIVAWNIEFTFPSWPPPKKLSLSLILWMSMYCRCKLLCVDEKKGVLESYCLCKSVGFFFKRVNSLSFWCGSYRIPHSQNWTSGNFQFILEHRALPTPKNKGTFKFWISMRKFSLTIALKYNCLIFITVPSYYTLAMFIRHFKMLLLTY